MTGKTKNGKILIIDDDNELCEELADMLSADGFDVKFTSDSREGEKLISNQDFGTIIMDYKMPYMNGIDILKKLKEQGLKRRIFMVSGRPFIEKLLEEENLKDMVCGVLGKPIDFELLRKKIRP